MTAGSGIEISGNLAILEIFFPRNTLITKEVDLKQELIVGSDINPS